MKLLLMIFLCLTALPAWAQEPRISMRLEAPDTIVGQPLRLEVEILVPTWMLKPPVYPGIDVPGVMVRLPAKSTSATSKRIDGATWAGVRRVYMLYPLQAGAFSIPAQSFVLTYADPETNAPKTAGFSSPSIRFDAVVPPGAEALNPPLIARGLELSQDIDGAGSLSPGDAVIRIITARIKGTTAILIPPLTGPVPDGAIKAYLQDPVVSDTEDGGSLSGSRSETVTYLAQAPGRSELPAVRIRWFDLEAGKLRIETLPSVSLLVEASDAAANGGAGLPRDWSSGVALGLGAVLLLAATAFRRRSMLRSKTAARYRQWLASEQHAHLIVLRAIRQRDHRALYQALHVWQQRAGSRQPPLEFLEAELAGLGFMHASRPLVSGQADKAAWHRLRLAYLTLRKLCVKGRNPEAPAGLPPLNPF